MRALRWMALVLVLALLSGGVAEAKGPKGPKGRGKAKFTSHAVTRVGPISRDVRVRSSARTSFPPGYAWGLRRNRGEPVPLGAPVRRSGYPFAPVDGQQIFRAGRVWEFDASDNRWELLDD